MELRRQFGDFYGNDNSRFCQFDEIKWDFIRNDDNHSENSKSLKLFHQLLKMGNGWKLNTKKLLTINRECEYIFSFVILSDSKENYNHHNNQYPIIPILFPKWTPGCIILDTSIVNITKPLMREGISLIDSPKYTAFTVFQVKICYQSYYENDESEIVCDSIYILLTKKYEKNLNSNPYSIMWKVCNRNGFESMFQINVGKIGIPTPIDYPVNEELDCKACFFDQGRKLQIHTNFYEVCLGTLVDFIKTYQTWRFIDSESIGEFEEYNLKNRITKALITRNWKVMGHVEEHFYIVVNLSLDLQRYTMKVCVVNYDNIKKMINK